MFDIHNGPFKGTSFDVEQAYRLAGDPITGEPDKAGIAISALNQRFLEVFNPLSGWSVRFRRQMLELDMYPLPRLGEVVTEPVPCVEFTAELVNEQDRVVNSASTIWTIRGPTEWEKGETNARIRLYEAVGLQARFPIPDGMEFTRAPELPGGTAGHASVRSKPVVARDDSMPYFEPVVEDDEEAPRRPVAASQSVVEENPLGDGPAANAAETTTAVERTEPTPAPAEPAASNVRPIGTKTKRTRLPDDAPAPEALMQLARTTAAMRGKQVPTTLKTKGEVNSFIASLG